MDDVTFRIEMQFNPPFLNEAIQHRKFLEAALHPVNLICHHRDALFLAFDERQHLVELLALAVGGGFDHREGFDDLQFLAFAILPQAVQLRVNRITLFLLLRRYPR
ncbi:MAG: hypothetical protein H6908_03540 [Hyphomicrobiales bacterium]|nr:hypothetical protein [Hyphomicrobiales bacterium]